MSTRYTFKQEMLFCFFITIVISTIYGQVVNFEFTNFDDPLYVSGNKYVQNGLTVEGVKQAFNLQNDMGAYWHPLSWLSHMADVSFFGNQSGFHHLTNVLWHILNTCLLFIFLHRATRKYWASVFTASMFAVHPLNVESVAWITERKNLLSAFFWLLSCLTYLVYARSPDFKKYLLLVLVFIAGLLAKPMLVTLPFVFLLLDYWPLERITLDPQRFKTKSSFSTWMAEKAFPIIVEKIPLFFFAICAITFTTSSLGNQHMVPFSSVPLSLRIENLFVSYAAYIGKMIWPFELSAFYPFPKELSMLHVAVSILILGTLTIVILKQYQEKKSLTVGWLWFLGTLTPVSGIIQAGLWPSMADRHTYIPFIGLFMILAWSLHFFLIGKKYQESVMAFLTILIVLLFGTVTLHQVKHWKNSESLFEHTLTLSDRNHVAHYFYGSILVKKDQIDEAIKHFYKALGIRPSFVTARRDLILLLRDEARYEEANRVYTAGFRALPNSFEFLLQSLADRGKSLSEEQVLKIEKDFLRLDRLEKLIDQNHDVIKKEPENIEALSRLAILYDQIGESDSAIVYFNKVLSITPEHAETHFNLGVSLIALGQRDKAEDHFKKAIEINPSFVNAYINLGVLLAQNGSIEEAISYFAKAIESDPSSIDGHTNMGVMLYQLGRKKESIYHFQEALKLRPEDQQLKELLREASK